MASTINGTSTGSGGLVSTGDDSGILNIQTNETTAITVDASQNVGIGTSTINGRLNISGSPGSTSFQINAGGTLSGARRNWGISAEKYVAGALTIEVGASEGANPSVAVATFDSSGNLLVGTTTNYGSARTSINNSGTVLGLYCSGASGATGVVIGKESNDASTSQVLMQFLYNNGSSGLGQINGNGGSQAAFGSYSDIRLKENIIDLPSQLDNIMALRPVEFNWKDGTGHQIGFIAQEVNEVYPDVVGENADGMLTLTDMNKNDARLIKAIQEMKAIIDTQAETINALTARIVALESK